MIDFTKSKQYTLSIRLSTDGFSFSIYNPIHDSSLSFFEKEVEASLSLTANLKQAFRELDFLNHTYKRVNILMADKRFTLIPLELFEDDQSEMIFYHNHTLKENETVKYNILKKNNAVVIFGMDKSTCQFLSDQYPEARFYSQAAPLAEYFSAKSRLGNSKRYMLLFAVMPSTFSVMNVDICFLPIHLNVAKQVTESTICSISGSS